MAIPNVSGFFLYYGNKIIQFGSIWPNAEMRENHYIFFALTVWVNALEEIFLLEYLWKISLMYSGVRILALKMYMHRKGACLHICFSLLSIVITKENMLTICFHAYIMAVYSSNSIYFSLWHFHVLVILFFCITTFEKCLRQPY